jgi:PAS domain-containing protein
MKGHLVSPRSAPSHLIGASFCVRPIPSCLVGDAPSSPDTPQQTGRGFFLVKAWLDPADPRRSPREYRVQRRDGEVRWVEVRRLACFEGAGRERRCASLVGTVQEITERKERQERENLLMRETNHRAKNMRSVVDAIAHKTAIRAPEHFIELFSERIQALAAIKWRGVEVEELVRAQFAPFADLIGSHIVARGLLSFKCRFRASRRARAARTCHQRRKIPGTLAGCGPPAYRVVADDETFTMSWAEREGPSVSAPQRRGFGTYPRDGQAQREWCG